MVREVRHKSENFLLFKKKKKEREYPIKLLRKLRLDKDYWNEQGG